MPKPILVFSYISSWSLRAWIALRQGNVPFEERIIPWKSPERKAQILKDNPAGKVPALIDGDLLVHDSIAILEYVNETYLGGKLLPAEKRARAVCRSVCAEMHSGFPNLRTNLSLKFDRKPEAVPIDEVTRGEIERIATMWQALRMTYKPKGPYLFGEWSMADCMYLPVCARFDNYLVDLSRWPEAEAYSKMMLALPLFQEWKQKGFAAATAA
jgi:glutathione S-transferase